ncbi:MAG: winged helix-turn-helix transcriptional regulator [Bdellovibrionales bacterium]|nr:winged helix-turn-helix transcriptional regulator [Bdellovibrionales bacterium]
MNNDKLDRVFAALSDSTRRAILAKLANGDASVSELAKPFRLSQPAISKHLRVLEDAELIFSRTDGQRRIRELRIEALVQANGWIEKYREIWEASYKRLDILLEEMKATSDKKKAKSKHKSK